jgi:hypothetical protein
MKTTPLAIPGVMLLEPKVFSDDRGFFFESFNHERFETAIGRSVTFVQDNHSCSSKQVLRGLHYQIRQPQGKLIRVVRGEVFDVAVVRYFRQRTSTNSGFRKGLLMVSSSCRTRPSASTKPPATMRRSTNAALSGTTRRSVSSGLSRAHRFYPSETGKGDFSLKPNISHERVTLWLQVESRGFVHASWQITAEERVGE